MPKTISSTKSRLIRDATTAGRDLLTAADVPAQQAILLDGYATESWVASAISGLGALTSEDIDTLAEINAILTDADVASQTYVDDAIAAIPAVDLSGYVPYTGATADLNLGAYKVFSTAGLHSSAHAILNGGQTAQLQRGGQGYLAVMAVNDVRMVSGTTLAWVSSTANLYGMKDVILGRDGAGALGLRNGTNAQAFSTYSTYTSATSFESLKIQSQTAGSYQIGSAIGSAGGTNRDLEFGHWDSAGTFDPAISIRPGSTQTHIYKPMSPTLGQWAWTWGYHNGGPSVYGGARTVGNNMVLSVSGSAGKIFHMQNGSGVNVQSLSMDTGNLTLTGDITLPQDPTSALHAATKQYVDTSRMYSTEQYASTATYNYFGFTTVDGLWKVNRFDVTTGAKTTAQDSNNGPGTYADLTAAWVDYLTLVYA